MHLSNYQDWYLPTDHLPTALRPRGTFPSRHQTENSCRLRNEGFTVWREPGSNGSPEGTPIELQYNLGLFWDIWGLFWVYFGYAIGGINKSTNSRPVTGHQTPKRWPDHAETGCGERTNQPVVRWGHHRGYKKWGFHQQSGNIIGDLLGIGWGYQGNRTRNFFRM